MNSISLKAAFSEIRDKPAGWTLWVIVGGRLAALRPGNSGDHCKTIMRSRFFGGAVERGESFIISWGDAPWAWCEPSDCGERATWNMFL